jgi:acyl-coenzyme A synthetase/AMP-(fatty) acid ligase
VGKLHQNEEVVHTSVGIAERNMTSTATKTKNSHDFLLDRLRQNASRQPSKLAVAFLVSGPDGGQIDQQLTYQQLEQKTSELAGRMLTTTELKKGDW